jgi:hypothetical protein
LRPAPLSTPRTIGVTPRYGAQPSSERTALSNSYNYLIDHGADPTIDNYSGIGALNLARQVRKVNYLTVFEHRQGQSPS